MQSECFYKSLYCSGAALDHRSHGHDLDHPAGTPHVPQSAVLTGARPHHRCGQPRGRRL